MMYLYENPAFYFISATFEENADAKLIAAGSLQACEAVYRLHDWEGYAICGPIVSSRVLTMRQAELEAEILTKFSIALIEHAPEDDALVREWTQNELVLKEISKT